MRQFFRSVTMLLLVGGWALASAAVHVVRTPTRVVVVTKNELGYADTYVDTRAWTLEQDRAHPLVVARLLQLGKSATLAHTVSGPADAVQAQLVDAVQHPTAGASTSIVDKAKAEAQSLANTVSVKIN